MPKFKVTFTDEIEANSQEEAMEIVREMCSETVEKLALDYTVEEI